MTEEEIERLADEITDQYPEIGHWHFEYMFGGYFSYHRTDTRSEGGERTGFMVFFTPDFNTKGCLSVQITNQDGSTLDDAEGDEVPYTAPLTAEQCVALVKPWLDLVDAKRPIHKE